MVVYDYAGQYVTGLQGNFAGSARPTVISTAKHFMGDGGTDQGKDQGENKYDIDAVPHPTVPTVSVILNVCTWPSTIRTLACVSLWWRKRMFRPLFGFLMPALERWNHRYWTVRAWRSLRK